MEGSAVGTTQQEGFHAATRQSQVKSLALMATPFVRRNTQASTRVTGGQKEPHIIDVSLVKCSNSHAVRQCDMRIQRTSAVEGRMSMRLGVSIYWFVFVFVFATLARADCKHELQQHTLPRPHIALLCVLHLRWVSWAIPPPVFFIHL